MHGFGNAGVRLTLHLMHSGALIHEMAWLAAPAAERTDPGDL